MSIAERTAVYILTLCIPCVFLTAWPLCVGRLRLTLRSEHLPASSTGLSFFPPGFRPFVGRDKEGVPEQDLELGTLRHVTKNGCEGDLLRVGRDST